MKKKVALLLALVMVLSMLPMNVFGVNNPSEPRIVNAGQLVSTSPPAVQFVVLEFDVAYLRAANPAAGASIELRLHGGDARNAFFPATFDGDGNITALNARADGLLELRSTAAAGTPIRTWADNQANWPVLFLGERVLVEATTGDNPLPEANNLRGMTLHFPAGVIDTDLEGVVQVRIPVVLTTDGDVGLSMTLAESGNASRVITSLARTRINRGGGDRNITFGEVTPRTFATEILPLPDIRINETQLHNFRTAANADVMLVRLEAPVGYRWHMATSFRPTIHPQDAVLRWGLATGNATLTPTFPVGDNGTRAERVNNTVLDVLYIQIPVNNMPANATFPRSLDIRNLHLVPTEVAPASGPVNVHIATLPAVPVPTDGDRVARPTNDSLDNQSYRVATLHVGNRATEGLAMSLVSEELAEIRTGYFGDGFEASPLADYLGGSEWGQQTATIAIRELAPGAWQGLLGDRIEFRFEQQGVSVLGAAARLGYNDDINNQFGWATNAWLTDTRDGGSGPEGQETTADREGVSGNGNMNINTNRVEVIVPAMTQATILRQVRTLEVTFWISVAAGFEAQNPGDDIYVTVSGRGAALLPANNRTIAVATPVDPISIALPQGPINLGTDLVGDTVANARISDIVITVYEPATLREGTSLFVAVSGIELANRALGLHVSAENVVVSGRGLVLGGITAPSVQTGVSVTQGIGFNIPINRVPSEWENDGPITITLSGVRVTGTVVPGVEYHVVVGGNAVDQTFSPVVWNGHFSSLGYTALAVTNQRTPAGGGNVRPGGEVVISIHDRLPGVDQEPITFRTVATRNVGLVSMRAFAYLIGGEPVPNYPSAGDWTIRGVAVNGDVIQITVNDHSPSVRVVVNGDLHAETDLARWAGDLTGVPAGQLPVFNINGNVFLPFRAMANIFGYDVEMVTAFSIRFFS